MLLMSFHLNKKVISMCYILLTLISYAAIKLYYLSFISENVSQKYKRNNTILNNTNYDLYKLYKHILVWPNQTRFKLLDKAGETFVKNNCEYKNCFVTDDVHLLPSVTDFDAVVFNGLDMTILQKNELLKERSPKQKYIFAAYESSVYVPMCFQHFDGFFNLTWTYKLDSDIVATYFKVYDVEGNLVGPRKGIKWVNNMLPINEELKNKLSRKTRAIAWVVDKCVTFSQREELVKKLKIQLVRFGLTVDIYGKCGTLECPGNEREKCDKLIEDNYFFYLAFENSWASDYVTQELSTALNNYAVPIVYGGADYTRFVPKGAYLDARELRDVELAYKINDIMKNRTIYHDYFRWRNHYTYTNSNREVRTDVCQLCAMLNDKDEMLKVSVWNTFREWWNEGNFDCRYHEFYYLF